MISCLKNYLINNSSSSSYASLIKVFSHQQKSAKQTAIFFDPGVTMSCSITIIHRCHLPLKHNGLSWNALPAQSEIPGQKKINLPTNLSWFFTKTIYHLIKEVKPIRKLSRFNQTLRDFITFYSNEFRPIWQCCQCRWLCHANSFISLGSDAILLLMLRPWSSTSVNSALRQHVYNSRNTSIMPESGHTLSALAVIVPAWLRAALNIWA